MIERDTAPPGADAASWKRYRTAVDRVLATWEAVEDWPDNIAFLSRLLKVLKSFPTVGKVPYADRVAHRLALCLLPALPAGVHGKALDVYAYILGLLGRDRLAEELHLWLTGLSPVLSYGNITVRASLITLLSTFFVPLGTRLRQALRGLVLALLPGLEDEHDEIFSTCLTLADEMRAAVDAEELWWSTLWLAAMRTDSAGRTGCLNYLLRAMPKSCDQLALPDPGLLVKGMAAGLLDEEVLVQRGFLELLVTKLPLDTLQRLPGDILAQLVGAACAIVLRRDVALNRRLYAWLTGPPTEDEASTYFEDLAKPHLERAIIDGFRRNVLSTATIYLSLLDRDDIGPTVLDAVFPVFLDEIYRAKLSDPQVVALFDAIPAEVIFRELVADAEPANLDRITFLVDTFDFTDEVSAVIYLPKLAFLLLAQSETAAMELGLRLLAMIPAHALDAEVSLTNMNNTQTTYDEDTKALGGVWQSLILQLLSKEVDDERRAVLWRALAARYRLRDGLLPASLRTIVQDSFVDAQGMIALLRLTSSPIEDQMLRSLCHTAYAHLGSATLAREVDSAEMLTFLASRDLATTRKIISTQVASDLKTTRPIERFAALWTHLNPSIGQELLAPSQMLVLACLAFGEQAVRSYAGRWVSSLVDDTDRLFRPLLDMAENSLPPRTESISLLGTSLLVRQLGKRQTLDGLVYALTLVKAVLELHQLRSESVIERIDALCASAMQCAYNSSTSEGQLYALYRLAIEVAAKMSRVSVARRNEDLVDRLALATEQHLHVLQHGLIELILSADVHELPDIDFLSLIVVEGLSSTRSHPVLQDWSLLAESLVVAALEDSTTANGALDCVQCLCEQVDLNLVDLDVVLSGKTFTGQQSSHENVLIMVDLLRVAAAQIMLADQSSSSSRPSTSNPPAQGSGLLTAFGLGHASSPNTAAHGQALSKPRLHTIASIVRLGVRAWAWSRSGLTSQNRSTVYIADLVAKRSYGLLEHIYRLSPRDTVVLVAKCWADRDLQLVDAAVEVANLLSAADPALASTSLVDAARARWNAIDVRERSASMTGAVDLLRFAVAFADRLDPSSLGHDLADVNELLKALSLSTLPSGGITLLRAVQSYVSLLQKSPLVRDNRRARRELLDGVTKLLSQAMPTLDNTPAGHEYLQSVLIPGLPELYRDLDRVSAMVTTIVTSVIQPSLRAGNPGLRPVELLLSLSKLDSVQKAWRREAIDFFASTSFFALPREAARPWLAVTRAWLANDRDRINDHLARPNPAAPGNLFVSAESERVYKVAQNRRLVFLLLAMTRDAFLAKLAAIEDRALDLVDHTLSGSNGTLVAESLLLMQAILVRFAPEHLRGFFPTVVAELRRVLEHLCSPDVDLRTTASSANLAPLSVAHALLLAACRLADTVLALERDATQLHEWLLVRDTIDAVGYTAESAPSAALLARLGDKLGADYTGPAFSSIVMASVEEAARSMTVDVSVGEFLRKAGVAHYERRYARSAARVAQTATSTTTTAATERTGDADDNALEDCLLHALFATT